jgi:hypothetical protein
MSFQIAQNTCPSCHQAKTEKSGVPNIKGKQLSESLDESLISLHFLSSSANQLN